MKFLKFFIMILLFFTLGISSVSAQEEPIVAVVVQDGKVIKMTESQHKEFEKIEDEKYKEAMKETKRREEEAIDKGIKVGQDNANLNRNKEKEVRPFNAGLWSTITDVKYGSPYLDKSKRSKVSPTVGGPGSATVQYSVSVSASSNFSLDKLKGLGLSFTRSVSSDANFSVTFDVKENRKAHIEFIPRYRDITGYKKDYFDGTLLEKTYFKVSEPIKVHRFADGEYILVYE